LNGPPGIKAAAEFGAIRGIWSIQIINLRRVIGRMKKENREYIPIASADHLVLLGKKDSLQSPSASEHERSQTVTS
jgi:hypothetical protein